MNNQNQRFFRTLSILNSLLIPVFFLSLIEKLNLLFLLKFSFVFVFLIVGLLKVYCLSGIGGCILEIISAEELVLRMRAIHQNAKNLWQGFLIVFVVMFLVDFIWFAIFPSLRALRPFYFSLFGTFSAFVLARWTLNKKYTGPLGIPQRSFKFEFSFLMVMSLLCILEFILIRGVDFIHVGGFYWQDISVFMVNYVQVFGFIFCSLYIFDHYPEIKEKFSKEKEIFFINPMGIGIVHSLGFMFLRLYPPFFLVLKALSPKTYKFREFNQMIWHERYYRSKALVCITCFTMNCFEAYKMAKEFRKRGSKVVMGGPHVTFLPDEALAFCDSVVIGPAEGVWEQVIRDYENGTLKEKYMAPALEADFARVYEELLNSPSYIAKDFLETMRGCKFQCHFCTIPSLSGGKVHLQPIHSFVELIKKIKPRYPQVTFVDNNIYSDPGYAKELFIALKPLKIKWKSFCSIDIAKNQETLKLAKESGCVGLAFGYEISGESLEKNQGGKFGMTRKYIEYTKAIKKAGIKVQGSFIFGFDSDELKTLLDLWKFSFSMRPNLTSITLLTPLPGSGVYADMLAQDRIINLNWRNYNFRKFVIRHPHINPALVSFFFPLIQVFFLITTFWGSFIFLAVILLFAYAGARAIFL